MMRSAAIVSLLSLALLPACSVLFPEDPRIGEESIEACAARVTKETRNEALGITGSDAALWAPTYTYDITKLDLEAVQALILPGSDETAGSRLMAATNETATAVGRFMAEPADDAGAFFMGRDPALYRVRGKPLLQNEVIPAGCERQQANMRLIGVELTKARSEPADPSASKPENENNN
jgi:hypothetical protein